MLIGAGTLTTPSQVDEVAGAGGRLIVTPHADTAIVRAAKRAGLFACPGFFNPTEAFALLDAGADALKLFPAEVLGPPMLKALRAVLPASAIVIPVGGVDADQIVPWMAAGALGLGVGSSIYKAGDDATVVEAKAMALVAVVQAIETEPAVVISDRWSHRLWVTKVTKAASISDYSPWKRSPPLCHLDRSAAQWRDLCVDAMTWKCLSCRVARRIES